MVTVINRLTVTGDEAEFRRVLAEITAYMTAQPGFLSHRLYRSVRRPEVFVETAEWSEASAHRAAMLDPRFADWIGTLGKHAEAEPDVFQSA
jgi:quinol monooxygenase YgiN